MILFPERDASGWPDRLPDDHDPKHTHVAPTALQVVTLPDGTLDLQVVRYTASARDGRGGTLTAAIGLIWLDGEPQTSRAWPVSQRFRLRWRGPNPQEGEQAGAWRPALLDERGVLRCTAWLSEEEANAAEALTRAEVAVLELDLELGLRGRVPPLDWQVQAATAAAHAFLRSRLGNGPQPKDVVDAAVMSLPEGEEAGVTWTPTRARAAPASPTTLLAELAVRLRDDLFERSEPGWTLRELQATDPDTLVYNLSLPRSEVRTRTLRWSIDTAWRAASEQARAAFLTVEARMELVQRADVHVIHQLPLDPKQVLLLDAKVRFPQGQGQWQTHRVAFPAGTSQVRLPAARQIGVPFVLSYDAALVLAPLGGPLPRPWPPLDRRTFRPVEGTVVTLGPLELDVRFVLVSAEPGVFERAARIEALLHGVDGALLGRASLDPTHPSSAVPLPGIAPRAPLRLTAVAHPQAGGPAVPLRNGPLAEEPVIFTTAELLTAPSVDFEFSVTSDVAAAHAWLAVQVEDDALISLEPGRPLACSRQAPDVFTAPTCRYRVVALPWIDSERTAPLVEGAWQVASPGRNEVRP